MKLIEKIICVGVLTFLCLSFTTAQIIPFGSEWKYYDNEQEPPVDGQGDEWMVTAYDDSGWSAGNAELGYGDGDEATVINDQTLTAYYRKSFTVADPAQYTSLQVDLVYDDGAVVYLNGVEIWRVNMPSGTIDYNTFASSTSSDNATASNTFANNLVAGDNVISVELHQRSASSSDLSFNLKLTGSSLPDELPGYNANWKYYDNEQEPPNQSSTTWKESSYNDNSWTSGSAQLGYGDGDEATVINNQTLTAYFRHTFTVDDASIYTALKGNLLYDDGAVVYLNGTEVMRVNMDPGVPTYNTFASANSGDNAMSVDVFTNNLQNGNNTLAIEVHQRSASSSDLSFDFKLEGLDGSSVSIDRGPYLQKANDHSVTIKWRTDIDAKCSVYYGTDTSALTDSIVEAMPSSNHELTLSNLAAATTYYYEIRDTMGVIMEVGPTMYFKTHPTPGTEAPLRAWILGDCGTGNNNARAVRDAYYSYVGEDHTDMMLFLGDNAYNDGTDQQYQTAIFENMYEEKLKNTIAWSCLGNHDGYSADSDNQTGPYYDIFTFPTAGECGGIASGTEAYYSFDYGNTHFIILDSYDTDRSVGGAMYNWCLNDIQNTTAKWIVALWHHPPYTKGSHDSDQESNLIQMRERFLPILEDNGVDLVLSGHSHSYERSYYLNGHYGNSNTFDSNEHTVGDNGDGDGKIAGNGAYRRAINGQGQGEGTVYITTGSAGKVSSGSLNHPAMYYSVSSLGSCVLEITTDTMHVKFIRENGTVEDQFTITKCKGLETVENNQDSGEGSLRAMVNNACDLDTIQFNPLITDPIGVQSEIILDKHLFLKGNNPYTILSGNGGNRIFSITEGTTIELENLILRNGFSSTNGGALLNNGFLHLRNVEFENNLEGTMLKSMTNNGVLRIKSDSMVQLKQ